MTDRATPERLADLRAERIEIDYDLLADKLAQRLTAVADGPRLISAVKCARLYGHSARWWREHKADLGAVAWGTARCHVSCSTQWRSNANSSAAAMVVDRRR